MISLAAVGLWFGADLNTASAQVKDKDTKVRRANLGVGIPGTGTGAIPDGGPGCGPFGTPIEVSFDASGVSGTLTDVGVDMDIDHTWVGDIRVTLIAPDATEHLIFSDVQSTTATGCGDSSDLGNLYAFNDGAAGDWWAEALNGTGLYVMQAGDYRTSTAGDAPGGGIATDMTAAFSGSSPTGTWTLRVEDGGGGDTGAVNSANLFLATGPSAAAAVHNDFDGDGTTDYSVIRDESPTLTGNSTRQFAKSYRERIAQERDTQRTENLGGPPPVGSNIGWYIHNSGDSSATISSFGEPSSDFVAPADYDGDGKADITVWRSVASSGPEGAFFFIMNSSDSTVDTVDFGQTGDDPTVSGDYDGDGKADPAVFRCPSVAGQCTYFYKGSAGGGEITFVPWGNGTTFTVFPSPGDYDGDGKYDFSIQRTNPDVAGAGQFVLLRSSDMGVEYINWGLNTDLIIPGDYDGDGMDDIAIGRNQGGQRTWYILERDG
ncbi:MAG: hypothetical protein HKN43_15850, partial [Rhodothermales bacterium]|nr:hypothetical protein [Rhodothermales bacterium]